MILSKGDRIGPYEILALAGKGGMGVVYRARDSRLNRDVAIKVSDAQFTERFAREARAIAALSHANICHLYDIGLNYLVMEYVEGQDLHGPIAFDGALPIIHQLIDGIEAAHEKNLIHRDLKPANIKVTPEGAVKILDFGLAKPLDVPPLNGGESENSPTLTIAETQAGVILGTAAYMAPEQARGEAADKRSDIWSFGVILYEMLTGRRPFQGASAVEILGCVLNKEPDMSAAPPRARQLLRWCLEKDRKRRLQAIGDARWLLEDIPESVPFPPRSGMPGWLARAGWGATVALLLSLAVLSYVHFREKPDVQGMVRFEIPAPAGTTFTSNIFPAVSPDGRKIGFIAAGADHKRMLWVRSLDREEAYPLAGTEGANDPIWSPDGRFLAFNSGDNLKKIAASGGPVLTLCNGGVSFGAVWTLDNRILFGTLGPLQIVSAAGGTPTPLTALDASRNELGHFVPALLPDGHHFLYDRVLTPLESGGVYIGSLDASPDRQGGRKLLPGNTAAMYARSPFTGDDPGFLLFTRGFTLRDLRGTLIAQPFDARRMDFAGGPVSIAEEVNAFTVSPTGVLVYRTIGTQSHGQLTWYDRKGNLLSTTGAEFGNPYSADEFDAELGLALAPDGERVAYYRNGDLWLFEFARGVQTKFTFGNPAFQPAWSADGSRIVFTSLHGGAYDIYQESSNLAGQDELVYRSPENKGFPSWSRDGRFLMYSALSPGGRSYDLWILPTDGSGRGGKPFLFFRSEFNKTGRFSPDGRWVAYESNQSGRNEIYALPFDPSNPGSPAAGGLHQVSTDGGTHARWSRDGKELIYMALDGYLMSVEVNGAGGAFQTGKAQRLFKSPNLDNWDVSADGERFLIAVPAALGSASADSPPYHVVMNWTRLLKR